jgi:hypothetical protein
MKNRGLKAVSVLITIFIICFLIYSGPAAAFILKFSISNSFVELGKKATFFASAVIENNENLPISKFRIELNGPETIYCEFLPNGTKLTECKGFTIKPTSLANSTPGYGYQPDCEIGTYGYGYEGYGYQKCVNFTRGILGYNITFDTTGHLTGIYSTKYISFIGRKQISKDGGNLFIFNKNAMRGCSIRADRGFIDNSLLGGNISNGKNKLSLSVPLENAVLGQGSFLTQIKKGRMSYNFEVMGVLENSPQRAVILISGNYQLNRIENKSNTDLILINLDKKNKELSLAGKKLDVSNMRVTLMRNCN